MAHIEMFGWNNKKKTSFYNFTYCLAIKSKSSRFLLVLGFNFEIVFKWTNHNKGQISSVSSPAVGLSKRASTLLFDHTLAYFTLARSTGVLTIFIKLKKKPVN